MVFLYTRKFGWNSPLEIFVNLTSWMKSTPKILDCTLCALPRRAFEQLSVLMRCSRTEIFEGTFVLEKAYSNPKIPGFIREKLLHIVIYIDQISIIHILAPTA
jgi:hypothetical protein